METSPALDPARRPHRRGAPPRPGPARAVASRRGAPDRVPGDVLRGERSGRAAPEQDRERGAARPPPHRDRRDRHRAPQPGAEPRRGPGAPPRRAGAPLQAPGRAPSHPAGPGGAGAAARRQAAARWSGRRRGDGRSSGGAGRVPSESWGRVRSRDQVRAQRTGGRGSSWRALGTGSTRPALTSRATAARTSAADVPASSKACVRSGSPRGRSEQLAQQHAVPRLHLARSSPGREGGVERGAGEAARSQHRRAVRLVRFAAGQRERELLSARPARPIARLALKHGQGIRPIGLACQRRARGETAEYTSNVCVRRADPRN